MQPGLRAEIITLMVLRPQLKKNTQQPCSQKVDVRDLIKLKCIFLRCHIIFGTNQKSVKNDFNKSHHYSSPGKVMLPSVVLPNSPLNHKKRQYDSPL